MLSHKNYEYCVPTYKVQRVLSDRRKIVEMPLFPCYIFCRTEWSKASLIVSTPGVRQIVSCGGKACIVPDAEINALRQVMASSLDVSPHPYFKVGQRVEVKEGPLAGISGVIARINNRRQLIVSVDVVMKSVMVDIEAVKVCYGGVDHSEQGFMGATA
jgi:transcription antitermination factor NusG